MCVGEPDSLAEAEQMFLKEATALRLGAYAFQACRNDDALQWAVLEPRKAEWKLPRFTICRIDPAILVRVSDADGGERFCSTQNVEEAMIFAIQTATSAAVAMLNVHEGPQTPQ